MNQRVIHVSDGDEVHERFLEMALIVKVDCVTKVGYQLKESSITLMPFPVGFLVIFRMVAFVILDFLHDSIAELMRPIFRGEQKRW